MKHRWVMGVFLAGCAVLGPASAQDASRVDQLESQIQQLTGQVEELAFSVRLLQKQIGQQQGRIEPEPVLPSLPRKKLSQIAAPSTDGIEVIEESPTIAAAPAMDSAETVGSTETAAVAPGPKILGSMESSSAKQSDGGFEGQVLVPLGAEESIPGGVAPVDGEGIEQVSLTPQTPQALFEQSNEALLRRQFPLAQEGFKKLLESYPDHSLAGSAQYWLGETYYAQGDYRTAAQSFLTGYQKYPKGRRAPDSLLKLGLALNKLGQRDQACSSLGAVAVEYPKAIEAKKRATVELKRVGC